MTQQVQVIEKFESSPTDCVVFARSMFLPEEHQLLALGCEGTLSVLPSALHVAMAGEQTHVQTSLLNANLFPLPNETPQSTMIAHQKKHVWLA